MRAGLAFAIIGLLTLGAANPSAARSPRRSRLYGRLQAPAQAGTPRQAAARYLANARARLGLSAVSLKSVGPVRVWRRHRVVRFAQHHEGLPVFGQGVIVRLSPAGRARTVATFVAPGLSLITAPVVSAAEALREAAINWGRPRLGQPRSALGILDLGVGATLVWRVDGLTAGGMVRCFVDAVSGRVIRAFSLARSQVGNVYTQNPVATPTPSLEPINNLTGDGTHLTGRVGAAYHWVDGTVDIYPNWTVDQLATSDGTGFFYEPFLDATRFDDPFTEVNLYYHADRVDTYFRDQHGHIPTRSLLVVANYGEAPGVPYDNAFSTEITDGIHGIIFGQGTETDFGYDGDVVYHEFSHFVIDEVSQMGYLDMLFDDLGMHFGPGGLHEGLADYFSASLTDDSLNAEYALGSHARNLDNDRVCPDDIVGEPHDDGWIIGGSTWEIRQTLGDVLLADDLVFGALQLLDPSASFADFAAALMATAAELETDGDLTAAQVTSIDDILRARGMHDCGRSLPLDDGEERRTNPFGFDWLGRAVGVDCDTARVFNFWLPQPFQYRIDVPADAKSLYVRVRHSPDEDIRFRTLLRKAEPVGYAEQPLFGGLSLALVRDYDHDFSDGDATELESVLTIDSSPALEPGATYYVAVVHQNCPLSQSTVSAWTSTRLPGDVDPPKKKGCSCQSGSNSGLPARPFILLLAGFLALRRRRRRR